MARWTSCLIRFGPVLLLASALTICGCGGGDGDAGSPTPGTLQFSAATFGADEAGGAVTVTVTRSGGNAGVASVAYVTTDDTATGASDYTAVSGRLAWADGEAVAKTFMVSVVDDANVEGDETVHLDLSNVEGASLGTPRTAVFTIADNDTATLSGTIRVDDHTMVDGDVNDPNAPFFGNDGFATAHSIPSPVSLGGYVNESGVGPDGPSRLPGDPTDFYRVVLAANQTIRLHIGDPESGDLDLFVYDSGERLVDASLGTGTDESVAVASGGEFFVEVRAVSGASKYVLAVGLTRAASEPGALRLSDDFVPGEVIVHFRHTSLPANGVHNAESRARALGLVAKGGGPDRPALLSLGDEHNRRGVLRNLGLSPSDPMGSKAMAGATPETLRKWETLRAIKALSRREDVLYAEPNYFLHPLTTTPNDEFFGFQWHYSILNLPQAWDITTGAENEVIVAIIDTGALLNHPDLQGKFTNDGYDFIRDPSNALDGDGIDSDPNDPGDQLGPSGASSFHGTHVAGTVAASTNNGLGVAGVSWFATIMPLRALGRFGGTTFDIGQAVRYAAGLPNDSNSVPGRRADIINLSFGGPSFSQAAQGNYTAARNEGVIIVAAAGNGASSAPMYPASYEGVVSVSAVDINRNLAPYSSFGSTVDVAAPGGNSIRDVNGDSFADGVLSTWADDSSGTTLFEYRFQAGTSMAAPHVAGVAALMKAVNPDLTPGAFDSLLAGGTITEDLGNLGRDDQFGHGLINAHDAVTEAQLGGGTAAAPDLVVTPASLNFGAVATGAVLSVRNGGGGALTLGTPSVDVDWLTVTGVTVDPQSKLGTYSVIANRSSLSDGNFEATITFLSTVSTVTIPVSIQKSNVNIINDAGFHYILLIESDTGVVIDQVQTVANNGSYSYTFSGVPGNKYEIWAGTDLDNDSFICGEGEACGVYATLEFPTPVTVRGNVSQLDFDTGFRLSLSAQSAAVGAFSHRPGLRRIPAKRLPR
jgi:serine protease